MRIELFTNLGKTEHLLFFLGENHETVAKNVFRQSKKEINENKIKNSNYVNSIWIDKQTA